MYDDLLNQKEDTILCPQVGSQHPDCPLSALGDNLGNLSGRLEYEGKTLWCLICTITFKASG